MHPTTKPSPPGLSHIPLHTPQPRGRAQLWVLGQARGALPGRPQILLRANSRSWGAGRLFLLCATIFLRPLRFPPPPGASAGGWAQLPRVQHPRAQLPRPPPAGSGGALAGRSATFPGTGNLASPPRVPAACPRPGSGSRRPRAAPAGVPGPRRRGEPGRGAPALRGFCAGAARPRPAEGRGRGGGSGGAAFKDTIRPGLLIIKRN